MTLLAKAQQRRGAAEITPLEFCAGYLEMLREARDVSVGHVHETLLLTAADASRLALKAHGRVYREIQNSRKLKLRARFVSAGIKSE